MKAEVRAILDLVEDVLMRDDVVASDLALILSALRGPDDTTKDTYQLKLNTTACIRSMAFPRLYASIVEDEGLGNTANWTFNRQSAFSAAWPSESLHFHEHIKLAKKAIDRCNNCGTDSTYCGCLPLAMRVGQ